MNDLIELKKLQGRGVLVKKRLFERDIYRVKRPVVHIVTKNVIERLESIYRSDRESGGFVVFVPNVGGDLVSSQVIEVPNKSNNKTSYQPDNLLFESVALSILSSGRLPYPFHTHPTDIGIDQYDNRKPNFFLGASKADKSISFEGIGGVIELPEIIFVKDARFKDGYKIAFYSGNIFPDSYNGVSVGLAIAAAFLVSSRVLGLFAAGVPALIYLGWEFNRLPVYTYYDKAVSVELKF